MLQKRDPRNQDIQVNVNGTLYHRDAPAVSVFDSVVQGGDAVWEGLRLYREGIICLSRHLQRLTESAHSLCFQSVPDMGYIRQILHDTLTANHMTEGVHIRLTLTRGVKVTSGMDPRLNQSGCTLIVVPEWKAPVYDNEHGIRVITSSQRRNNPQFLDSKIHHNNLLNNILAKIEANVAGADAALMLDEQGFASELNGTNLFMIKSGVFYTPHTHNCLPGITRGMVCDLCRQHDIPLIEKNISLSELYNADQVFCTGTMGELTPIVEVDGREVSGRIVTQEFKRINDLFHQNIPHWCEAILHSS